MSLNRLVPELAIISLVLLALTIVVDSNAKQTSCDCCPTITLSPSFLPNVAKSQAYAQTITASGGTGSYRFAVSTGILPPGLTLSLSSGLLSGMPTTVGNFTFTVEATDQSQGNGSQFYTIGVLAAAKADFSGDGKSDILWQNNSTGDRAIWLMNETAYSSGVTFGNAPTQWQIVGNGDFNGDGKTDVVWQNSSTGECAVWFLNGTSYAGGSGVFATVPTEWQIATIGDFNGDGKPDILWQNSLTGDRGIWLMNGTSHTGTTQFQVPVAWRIVGAGDFNGDSKTDILWQNGSTGECAIWFMNGISYAGGSGTFATVPTEWHIAGTGDFNNDGKPDIVWQNVSTGERAIWLMNGTVVSSGIIFASAPVQWEIRNH